MGVLLAFAAGAAAGIIRERLFRSAEADLGVKDTAKYVACGFTREAEAVLSLFSKNKPKDKLITLTIPGDAHPAEVLQMVLEALKKHYPLPADLEAVVTTEAIRGEKAKRAADAQVAAEVEV